MQGERGTRPSGSHPAEGGRGQDRHSAVSAERGQGALVIADTSPLSLPFAGPRRGR